MMYASTTSVPQNKANFCHFADREIGVHGRANCVEQIKSSCVAEPTQRLGWTTTRGRGLEF